MSEETDEPTQFQEDCTKFYNELHALLVRWSHESDIPDGMMIAGLEVEKQRIIKRDIELIEELEDDE